MNSFTFIRSFFSLALLILGIHSLSAQAEIRFHPSEIMVKLVKEGERSLSSSVWTSPESNALLRRIGVEAVEQAFPTHDAPDSEEGADLSRIYTVRVNDAADPDQIVRELSRMSVVEYAERKVLHEVFFLPNDPLTDTINTNGQWGLSQVKAFDAWDIQQGDTSVVIAVIDAGQSRHVDLYPNIAFNLGDPIDGIDNDGDGYVDNYEGWDFSGPTAGALPDNDPYIGDSHGLWVAGVSSATFNNNLGLAGVGGKCRFLPLKAAPDDSLGLIFEGYEAIIYAADQGAQIINCSWGSPQFSRFGQDAVRYATQNKQAAVIAAAGNSQSEMTFYPAGFDEVLSVASSSFEDTVFSGGFGLSGTTYDETVDVSAPGFAITSTRNTVQYGQSFTGTSFASPFAAGVVAITLSEMDDLTPYQAAQRVRVTADQIDSLNAPQYADKIGRGRVNMLRALTDPLKPSIRQTGYDVVNQEGTGRLRPGDTVAVSLNWINDLHPSTNDLELKAEMFIQNTPFITVLSTGASPGSVGMNQAFQNQMMKFVISSAVPEDYPVDFRLTYQDDSLLYDDVDFFRIRVNPTWITTDINAVNLTVTSSGNLGYTDFPDNDQGDGMKLDGGSDLLYESGVMFSSSLNQVSDAIRNTSTRDKDFLNQSSLYVDQTDLRADMVIKGTMSDGSAAQPIGLSIEQEIFGWSRIDRRQFLILQYVVENTGQAALPGLYASMFTDWDLTNGLINRNGANYSALDQFAYTEDLFGGTDLRVGVAVLSEDGFSSFAAATSDPFQFNTSGKASAMRTPLSPSGAIAGYPSGQDVFQFVNTGPVAIPAGEKDTITFAILATTDADQAAMIQEARNAWECEILDRGPNTLFSVSDLSPMEGETIQFLDQNSGQLTWSWDFGDGATSTIRDPQHVYASPGTYLARLTVSDGACTQNHAREIQVLMSTSLEVPVASKLQVYPNPTDRVFTLVLPQSGIMNLVISDMAGRTVFHQSQAIAANEGIAVSPELPPGVYHLGVTQGAVRWNKILVIQD